ncbi:ABC transporter ATP-binding protein [Treponema pedis]|uniref:ABC transporter ATP-binding protein n=1 Tax=Treponema pedis TaxID=409322 RepID=UPI003133EF9E
MSADELLIIEDLSVAFKTGPGKPMEVLDKIALKLERGKTLSLVGESGCGKSVTASSIMRLLPQPYGIITNGRIMFEGQNILDLPIDEMYKKRGSEIAMIFQEPMTALNPVHVIEKQIGEVFELHRPEIKKEERTANVLNVLKDVEMPSAEQRLKNYPFQLSGGMRQRVMIAMALAGHPKLLIADEPTTALDVTVQAQILALIKALQVKNNMGVLYITHDMGVVAEVSDTVAVMYAGQIVETADAVTIFKNPRHPYTQGLIASMPKMDSEPKTHLPYIEGTVPSPRAYPATCRFADRCSYAVDYCRSNTPVLEEVEPGHVIRCFRAKELE